MIKLTDLEARALAIVDAYAPIDGREVRKKLKNEDPQMVSLALNQLRRHLLVNVEHRKYVMGEVTADNPALTGHEKTEDARANTTAVDDQLVPSGSERPFNHSAGHTPTPSSKIDADQVEQILSGMQAARQPLADLAIKNRVLDHYYDTTHPTIAAVFANIKDDLARLQALTQ